MSLSERRVPSLHVLLQMNMMMCQCQDVLTLGAGGFLYGKPIVLCHCSPGTVVRGHVGCSHVVHLQMHLVLRVIAGESDLVPKACILPQVSVVSDNPQSLQPLLRRLLDPAPNVIPKGQHHRHNTRE